MQYQDLNEGIGTPLRKTSGDRVLAAVYVGLPILAPALMNAGITEPARTIYTIYSPMCHQMASRSFFLFGEQPAYPRELAGTELTPIEAYMDDIPAFEGVPKDPEAWTAFLMPAREFLGNDTMGYKMALCERDIAIYGFVLLGSLLYWILRRGIGIKIPALPIWAFIVFGMGPIALDGFSQLLRIEGDLIQDETRIFLRDVYDHSVQVLDTVWPTRGSTTGWRQRERSWEPSCAGPA